MMFRTLHSCFKLPVLHLEQVLNVFWFCYKDHSKQLSTWIWCNTARHISVLLLFNIISLKFCAHVLLCSEWWYSGQVELKLGSCCSSHDKYICLNVCLSLENRHRYNIWILVAKSGLKSEWFVCWKQYSGIASWTFFDLWTGALSCSNMTPRVNSPRRFFWIASERFHGVQNKRVLCCLDLLPTGMILQ